MTDHQDPGHAAYDQAREAFDSLELEEKAVFLVKGAVKTVLDAVEAVTDTIRDECSSVFGGAAADEAARDNEETPDPPEE